MIRVFGNDIKGAYTGGVPVKEIYSYGVKVWPDEPEPTPVPTGYTRIKSIYNDVTSNAPRLYIPVLGVDKFIIELDIEPTQRDHEFVFSYGTSGYFDTNYCFFETYTGSSTWYLESGNTTGAGGTSYRISTSDFVRGILKWDCSIRSDKPYITWQSLVNKSSYADSRVGFYLSLLSSNVYEYRTRVAFGKIYGVVIKDGNSNVIKNLVPVLEDSTGLAGLYDTVNNVFHKNIKSVGIVRYETL